MINQIANRRAWKQSPMLAQMSSSSAHASAPLCVPLLKSCNGHVTVSRVLFLERKFPNSSLHRNSVATHLSPHLDHRARL